MKVVSALDNLGGQLKTASAAITEAIRPLMKSLGYGSSAPGKVASAGGGGTRGPSFAQVLGMPGWSPTTKVMQGGGPASGPSTVQQGSPGAGPFQLSLTSLFNPTSGGKPPPSKSSLVNLSSNLPSLDQQHEGLRARIDSIQSAEKIANMEKEVTLKGMNEARTALQRGKRNVGGSEKNFKKSRVDVVSKFFEGEFGDVQQQVLLQIVEEMNQRVLRGQGGHKGVADPDKAAEYLRGRNKYAPFVTANIGSGADRMEFFLGDEALSAMETLSKSRSSSQNLNPEEIAAKKYLDKMDNVMGIRDLMTEGVKQGASASSIPGMKMQHDVISKWIPLMAAFNKDPRNVNLSDAGGRTSVMGKSPTDYGVASMIRTDSGTPTDAEARNKGYAPVNWDGLRQRNQGSALKYPSSDPFFGQDVGARNVATLGSAAYVPNSSSNWDIKMPDPSAMPDYFRKRNALIAAYNGFNTQLKKDSDAAAAKDLAAIKKRKRCLTNSLQLQML